MAGFKEYILEFRLADGTMHSIPFRVPLGEDGEDGGYYTPVAREVSDRDVEITFVPSKPGMPVIAPFIIKGGEPGKDGTVSFDELTEAQRESLKGDPFRYEDFTAEQLEALKGEPGYTPQKDVDYFDGRPGYTPQKGIDYFDGKNGVSATHGWNGTVLTVTSASGTSSADLKGDTGGYYTPTVSQVDASTMRIRFSRSNTSMPNIAAKDITLPSGSPGDDYVLTEEDKAEIAEMAADMVDIPDSGAQADWNQNDPIASGYINNRTHYEESSGVIIEWDGNTEGRETFEMSSSEIFYKVSDLTPTRDELIGAKISFLFTNNNYYEQVIDEDLLDLLSTYLNNCFFYEILVAYNTDISVDGKAYTVPSTGTWCKTTFKKLSYDSITIKTLDEKFIPDTIARVRDITSPLPEVTADNNGAFLRVVDGSWDIAMPDSGGNVDQVSIEPADNDIPKVFLSGAAFSDMTIDKNEVNMVMDYISQTDRFTSFIKIKFQGTSSMAYAKKNFTAKLYSDEAREAKLKKDFKDWNHPGNKFVLKANWVDHSHARNIVSANLWSEVVDSRSDYDTLPVEMRNSPRNGAIDGFPVKLYVNGTYQGIYTWNIGKDDWMWGMDEDNPNHVLMCAETNVSTANPCNFNALWDGVHENNWSVEVGTNSTALKNSLNNLIQFVMDNNGEVFKSGIGAYLDIQSAIDYYIHQYVTCGLDGLAKNMLLATYDGTKWICGAYDMDSTFGLWWDGGTFVSAEYKCPEEYQANASLLWKRIAENYVDELKARYAELRSTVYSYSNMVVHFERFMDTIGLDLYAEDLTIYPAIPSGGTNNIKQIRDFIRDRLEYCDSRILVGDGVAVEYIESDGASWVDTGIMPDNDMLINFTYMNPEYEIANENYFGSHVDDLVFRCSGATGNHYVAWRINGTDYTSSVSADGRLPTGIQRTVQFDTSVADAITPKATIHLFTALHNNNVAWVPGTFRLYGFKITRKSTGKVLLDFVPMVDGDGVPGLYDHISKKMFYNAGSGTFTVPAT